jgi:hypothetical protein
MGTRLKYTGQEKAGNHGSDTLGCFGKMHGSQRRFVWVLRSLLLFGAPTY